MANLKLALLVLACATLLTHTAALDTDTAVFGPVKCVKTNTSAACDELDECVWCTRTGTNSTVGTGCFPVKVADLLPRKFFECDKPPTPPSSDDGAVAASAVRLAAATSSVVLPGGDAVKCVKQNTSEACDALPSCTWCARAGNASDIGTGCYPLKAAVILPKHFFTCDEKPDAPPANEAETSEERLELRSAPGDDGMSGFVKCVRQNASEACDALTSCTWCARTGNASDIGTGCYPLKVAGILPKSFFECDVKPDAAPASALPEDQVDEEEAEVAVAEGEEEEAEQALEAVEVSVPSSPCDSKPQASCLAPECVWCTSAAVGGGCFTPDQAKKLPSAIFKCDSTPGVAAWRRFM